MSDLIICKAWVDVEPKKLYNPMIDDGLPPDENCILIKYTKM